MKYLHIISTMDPKAGGPCQGIRNLTTHSHTEGHTVEVVCLDDPHADYLAAESHEPRAAGAPASPPASTTETPPPAPSSLARGVHSYSTGPTSLAREMTQSISPGSSQVSESQPSETANCQLSTDDSHSLPPTSDLCPPTSDLRSGGPVVSGQPAMPAFTIHALGKGRGAWCYHPALRPWLEQNLSRFDAVILNGLWQYPGFVLSQLANRPGTPPYFVYPHGMLDPWFQRAPERRLKAIRNWFYWKLIERHVIHRATAVLFTCAEELRLARDTFRPYQPQREINVGYGISDPPEFNERMVTAFAEKCPGLNGRPYFLYLSRIHPKKGVDLLIRAYAQIYRPQVNETTDNETKVSGQWSVVSGPPAPPALVIAGPGLDTAYGRQMQRLASDLCPPTSGLRSPTSGLRSQASGLRSPTSGLRPPVSGFSDRPQSSETPKHRNTETPAPAPAAPSAQSSIRHPPSSAPVIDGQKMAPAIFFPGMLTGDAKWGALYGCDAFVLTSHQENFGIAVAEALACGKPVLISNQINIWREIEEEKAGVVAPDTQAGANQLFSVWTHLSAEEKAVMTRAAKASYLNRFGVGTAAKNLLATMAQLVAEKKK